MRVRWADKGALVCRRRAYAPDVPAPSPPPMTPPPMRCENTSRQRSLDKCQPHPTPPMTPSPFSPSIQSTSVCLSFTSTPLFLARNTLPHEQQAHPRPSSSAAPPRPLTPGSLPRTSLPACGLTIATAYGMFKSSERVGGREGGREGGKRERKREGVCSHTLPPSPPHKSITPTQEHHAP